MTPLYMPLNQAVTTIASKLFPKGFDLTDHPFNILNELRDHIKRTGRMIVYRGHSDQTIFGDPEVNWAFRAWHDHCHLRARAEFSTDGEFATFLEQASDIRKLYGASATADKMVSLIHAEVVGQVAYARQHGHFPVNQRAFVEAYLWNPANALKMDFDSETTDAMIIGIEADELADA